MTPERWRRAQEVFLAATERKAGSRAVYLDEECRGDAELRAEVESLLSSFKAAPGSFLESPAIERVPALPPIEPGVGSQAVGKGTRLGPYEILSPLGAGGMGEVYRAKDERLGREVAIKVVSAELSQESSRVKRFEKEARSASALNHPNIVTIYDTGASEGVAWIAMERVDGETLRKLVSSGPITIKKLLAIATQIADGLARAHEAGIVHRDLKPENVMVTRDGLVKILDFGLAKLTSAGSGSDEGSKLPTGSGTTPGVIMGTVGYMSPEQAGGAVVDFRSDQFSFGSILYELVTGKRAFAGKTPIDVLGAILNDEPQPIAAANPRTPTQLRWIVERCLSKEARQRYSSTDDLARDLAILRDHLSEAMSGAAVSHRPKRRFWRPLLLGVVGLLVAAGAVFQLTRRPAPPRGEVKLRQLTSNSAENSVKDGAMSPDGKYLVFTDGKGMHVELIETAETQSVPEPEALKGHGFELETGPWFPNSTRFLVNVREPDPNGTGPAVPSIWAGSVLGGALHELRDKATANSVSLDGSKIAFSTNPGEFGDREIWLMEPTGEGARKLYEADTGTGIFGLYWFRDGQRVAYTRVDKSGETIVSRLLKGGPVSTIFPPSETKRIAVQTWLPDGRLLYTLPEPNTVGECNYWEMRLDEHTGQPIGGKKRLTNWAGSCISNTSATEDGKRLAFLRRATRNTVYVTDLVAGGTRVDNTRHFTLTDSIDFPADWTSDSRAVIVLSSRNGLFGIYKQQLNQETAEPIVTGMTGVGNARVSADGKWILYVHDRRVEDSSTTEIMRVPISGGSPEVVFTARPGSLVTRGLSPSTLCALIEPTEDRKRLIITAFDPVKGRGQELTRFDVDPNFWSLDLSPDGTRIAAIRSPEGPIYVLSLSGQPTQEIRPKGWRDLLSVKWAADGKGLFVFNGPQGRAALLHVDLEGNAQVLWRGYGDSGSQVPALPSPDGRHLAMLDSATEGNFWMMENP